MDWIGQVQDRDKWIAPVNTVMNIWVPQNAGKFLTAFKIGGLSSTAQLLRVS
jgi:hypothetical protein